VPRIFDFPLCDFLIDFYERNGGEDSGFCFDVEGKTTTVLDHRLSAGVISWVALPEVRALIRDRIVRRLLPAIDRYFQFSATRHG